MRITELDLHNREEAINMLRFLLSSLSVFFVSFFLFWSLPRHTTLRHSRNATLQEENNKCALCSMYIGIDLLSKSIHKLKMPP